MNFLSIKKRPFFTQSLFFVATSFIVNSIIASEKSRINYSVDRSHLDPDNGYLNSDGSTKYPSIQILEEQPENKRYGVCFNYAISKQLGLKGQIPETLPIVGAQDWHTELNFTQHYCEEVSTPQPGDLITYYPDNRSLTPSDITHTGIVHDNGLVESKWGMDTNILLHPTFHVPTYYGNHVKYHRINKPTHEIIEDIKERIPNYAYDEVCTKANNQLVTYAEQSDNFNMWQYWQKCMCTNVEASNNAGQSLVMIGAKNNNLPLVKTALQHGANVNKKDKNNKTALDLARDNNHSDIIQILQQQKDSNQIIKISQNSNTQNTKKNIGKKTFCSAYIQ